MNEREVVKDEAVFICYYVVLFVVMVGLCCACRERKWEREVVSIEGREGAKRKVQTRELEPMRCFFPLVAFLYRFRGTQIWCLLFLLLFAFFPIPCINWGPLRIRERWEKSSLTSNFLYICFISYCAVAWIVTQLVQSFVVFLWTRLWTIFIFQKIKYEWLKSSTIQVWIWGFVPFCYWAMRVSSPKI